MVVLALWLSDKLIIGEYHIPSLIMHKSLSTGIYVDCRNKAKAIYIYKSCDICDVNNYRSVFFRPILRNIIERHIHDSLFA